MHEHAAKFVLGTVLSFGLQDASVLDLGGRNVNGNMHELFSHRPLVVDIEPGPGVDVVADAAEWHPTEMFDLVLCTETLEHTPRWREIITTAAKALHEGGLLIVTCATADRPPHGAATDHVMPGEWYENVDVDELSEAVDAAGFEMFHARVADGVFGHDDLYCWAIR